MGCTVQWNGAMVNTEFLEKVKVRMQEMIRRDIPINKRTSIPMMQLHCSANMVWKIKRDCLRIGEYQK